MSKPIAVIALIISILIIAFERAEDNPYHSKTLLLLSLVFAYLAVLMAI